MNIEGIGINFTSDISTKLYGELESMEHCNDSRESKPAISIQFLSKFLRLELATIMMAIE